MAATTYSQLLRTNARFRYLWTGHSVSELGNWSSYVAELGLARALSGSALAASLIVASHLLPFCVLGPFAGAIADRFPRRVLMLAADVARALLSLGFLFVTSPDRLWLAYVIAAAISSLTAFFEAAKNASMPNLAHHEQLLPATALMHGSRFLQMSLGAMVGGLATEYLGYGAAFSLNCASFIISAACVLRIPAPALQEEGTAARDRTDARAIVRDLGEAFAFIRSTPIVFAIVALNFGWALGGGMMAVISDRFGGIVYAAPGRSGDAYVAFLNAAAGLGLMTGMAVSRQVGLWVGSRERVGSFMGWAVIASGLVYSTSGLMPNVWAMGGVFVINRMLISAEYALQDTVLLSALPDALRGKVHTIDRSIELATMALSALIAAALFEALPPRTVPIIAGLLMASPGLLWLLAVVQGRLRVARLPGT